jgi:capsular polysaccharide transport system permease protein
MRSVGFALFLRELKTRLGGRWWGVVWVVGEPLANLILMLMIYGLFRAHVVAGVDTLLFLVTGLLPFQLFKSLVLRLMESIDANQGLFGYRQVRPIDSVFARAGVETALGAVLLLVAVAVLAWLGHRVMPANPLELLLASAVLIVLAAFLGLLAAVATGGVLARTRMVIRVLFFPLYLASGVLFPLIHLPQAALEVLTLNPLLHLLDLMRAAFFGDAYRALPQASLDLPLAWCLLVGVLSLSVYRVRRDRLQPV